MIDTTRSSISNIIDHHRLGNKPILIVAHDAGATYHIKNWISDLHTDLQFSLSGPAFSIMNAEHPIIANQELNSSLVANSSLVLSGTGWQTSHEHSSRIYSKELNIPNLAVIDHWVNYAERFTRQTNTVLPDALIVSDVQALNIAKRTFSHTPIYLLPNIWLETEITQESKLRKYKISSPAQQILYLCEPIRERWNSSHISPEYQALDYFLSNISRLTSLGIVAKSPTVYIKPHPSEDPLKYHSYIQGADKSSQSLRLKISNHDSLTFALAQTDLCIGCNTQALVLALKCGIPALCTLPPSAPNFVLPYPEITQIRNII